MTALDEETIAAAIFAADVGTGCSQRPCSACSIGEARFVIRALTGPGAPDLDASDLYIVDGENGPAVCYRYAVSPEDGIFDMPILYRGQLAESLPSQRDHAAVLWALITAAIPTRPATEPTDG